MVPHVLQEALVAHACPRSPHARTPARLATAPHATALVELVHNAPHMCSHGACENRPTNHTVTSVDLRNTPAACAVISGGTRSSPVGCFRVRSRPPTQALWPSATFSCPALQQPQRPSPLRPQQLPPGSPRPSRTRPLRRPRRRRPRGGAPPAAHNSLARQRWMERPPFLKRGWLWLGHGIDTPRPHRALMMHLMVSLVCRLCACCLSPAASA